MFGPVTAYVVAVSAMLFAGGSALTLIRFIRHLDAADVDVPEHAIHETAA